MSALKSARPAQVLAGKRAERVVMRNGIEGSRRSQDSTATIPGRKMRLDGCPKGPSTEVRLENLEKANLVRLERADTRRRLGRGELDWDDFLDDTPESCLQIPVVKALQWLPFIGDHRARLILLKVPDVHPEAILAELPCKAKYALSHQVTAFYERARGRGRRRRR